MSGIENNFIAAKVRVLKGKIDYYRNTIAAEKYESAVTSFNEGIGILNRFIEYRNHQFEFENDSVQLVQILDSTEHCFTMALKDLSKIETSDTSIMSSVLKLQHAIDETMVALHKQRDFLYTYLRNLR